MTDETTKTSSIGDDIIRPDDLRRIAEESEMAKLKEALEHEKKLQEEQESVRDAFMHQHIRPDAKERFTRAVRAAAERGVNEIQITRFPSSYCTDGGRAINNFEADWPDSLTGYAREAYEVFDKHLRSKGYKLRAQILDYPGGMPGDVGLFLRW
ncbi:hypothetical protein [Azospirillum rugosum]|uniref:Histidine kinase n=1 Tax=Azospirillum rugosum TaxID=416170 RepID=A0ABS4SV22_9PROT|nr:hypothetical protein [Azospirillum rugosum]MBP2295807.1 hypothetical protein [Azospirillum rugosum]MDQ0529082.1 hypothetical protein [Azospirillum rugosum]